MAIEWQQNNRSASGSSEIARLHSDDLNSTSSTESGQKDLSIDVSISNIVFVWEHFARIGNYRGAQAVQALDSMVFGGTLDRFRAILF